MVLLTILISFSYGCKPRTPGTTPEGEGQDVYKGYKGLEMEFMKNLPPAKMYDTTPLNILIDLHNGGTFDLTGRCELYLHGYDTNIIGGLWKTQPCGFLEAKTKFGNPEGGRDSVEFETDIIQIPEGIDSLPQDFVVTACYEYETLANPVVCIDPRLYEPVPIERACNAMDVILSGGQGAPVSVDKVEVETMKEKVLFKIHITNRGGTTTSTRKILGGTFGSQKKETGRRGTVLSWHSSIIDGCPFNLDYEDYNIVDYDIDMTGGSLIRCTPEIDGDRRIRLVDNKGVIYCYFDIYGDSAYTTPLNIQLNYNYMESISTKVDIIKTP